MQAPIITRMSEKDIDCILHIENASFRKPWHRSSFLNELTKKNSYNFVLKIKNSCQPDQIIAYLCAHLNIDEIHILKIAVHPDHRNRGYATAVLNQCLETMSNLGVFSAVLEVRELNAPAIGLYRKTGFHIEAQQHGYYLDTREDAILMRKTF